eukprot:3308391-Amphidinium_carterae.1
MALARQQMQALRDKVPTRLQNSLLDPQDRKLRRQKWLERMSDSNISYAAGYIKPITASPPEILQRLRE